MAQESGTKIQALRAKMEASGKKIPKEIWGRVDMIEHDLSYPMNEEEAGMDKLIEDVDKLLQKDDMEGLSNLLKGFAGELHSNWQRHAHTFIGLAIVGRK